jgi:hypothetical protein
LFLYEAESSLNEEFERDSVPDSKHSYDVEVVSSHASEEPEMELTESEQEPTPSKKSHVNAKWQLICEKLAVRLLLKQLLEQVSSFG